MVSKVEMWVLTRAASRSYRVTVYIILTFAHSSVLSGLKTQPIAKCFPDKKCVASVLNDLKNIPQKACPFRGPNKG